MKFFILATILAVANAGVISKIPKCVTIRNTLYEEEVLKTNVMKPYQLDIDYNTNTLFFSYTANHPTDINKIAYLNLESKDFGLVDGINGGFSSAVDSKANIVYLGGNDGVYTFNYDTKTATYLNLTSEFNIWQMFYKNGLYFLTYPDRNIYFLKTEEIVAGPEFKHTVHALAVKNDGSFLYYTNDTRNSPGLFAYSKNDKIYENIGDYAVNGFSSDINGNIYFSTLKGIYYIDDKKSSSQQVEELFTSDDSVDIWGVAVEGNGNIIYARENSIIRLKPTEIECSNLTVKDD